MKILDKKSTDIVAGGGTPGLVCNQTENSSSTSGDSTLNHSSTICQTSSGLTIITTTDTVKITGDVGLTGIAKKLAGLDVKAGYEKTSTDTTIVKPNGESTTTHQEKETGQRPSDGDKRSDMSDASDAQNFAFDQLGDDLGSFDAFAGGWDYGGGGGGDAGCVQIASFLPGGGVAGDITVGATMQLSDQVTLEAGTGEVSFSKRKKAQGFRVTTVSGVTLVCSDTAPIPTPEGLVLAPNLAGKQVAVRRDEGGVSHGGWEAVKSVEPVGEIEVQHITVGDKCFWAGERPNSFILHHNMKAASGGGSDEYLDEIDWDSVA